MSKTPHTTITIPTNLAARIANLKPEGTTVNEMAVTMLRVQCIETELSRQLADEMILAKRGGHMEGGRNDGRH